MSEYQYYEFRAIENPLTDRQVGELRKLSTRAEITPTSFTNEYQWGNFRGNPRKMMEKYFDAFLYYANWGTHWFDGSCFGCQRNSSISKRSNNTVVAIPSTFG